MWEPIERGGDTEYKKKNAPTSLSFMYFLIKRKYQDILTTSNILLQCKKFTKKKKLKYDTGKEGWGGTLSTISLKGAFKHPSSHR